MNIDEVTASAPIVVGIYVMSAVEMDIDLKNRCVWPCPTRSSLDSSESANSGRQSSGQKELMLTDKNTSSVRHATDASHVTAATAAFDVSQTYLSRACDRKKRDARSPGRANEYLPCEPMYSTDSLSHEPTSSYY